MDVTGDEVITAEDLKRSYDVTQHPKFKTGEWSRERILKEFLDTFQLGEKDDVVSLSFLEVCICILLHRAGKSLSIKTSHYLTNGSVGLLDALWC